MARAGRAAFTRYGYRPIPRTQLILLTLLGAMTLAGDNSKQFTFVKALNGALASSGATAKSFTFLKTLQGAVQPNSSTSFAFSLSRFFASDIAPSGYIVKSSTKNFDGSIAFSSFLDDLLVLTLTLVGSMIASGALVGLSINKNLNSDIAFESNIVRDASLNLNSYLLFESEIQRVASISFFGDLLVFSSFSKTLNAIRVISGSINPISNMSKNVQKTFDGTIASNGNLRKQISKVLAGIIYAAGSFVKQRVGEIAVVSASITVETIISITMTYEDTSAILTVDGI